MSQSAAIHRDSSLGNASRQALRALLYFDIFQYPLTEREIHQFSGLACAREKVTESLSSLVESGLVFKHGGYFSLVDDSAAIENRERGNRAAKHMMKTAYRFSRFISRFPYVRGVALSGSLSKGYVDELGDIDYFIVTKPGRLWIARTLLIAFKKVFLLNSKKYFCVNYFVDTNHLEIPDKNIFTATELLTLIPVYDPEIHQHFLQENRWAKEYLPNYQWQEPAKAFPKRSYPVKSVLESLLNGKLGERIDGWFMQRTMKRWRRKFEHFTPEYFDHALRTRKYVSKHHPQNFQQRVLQALNEKVTSFEKKHGLNLEADHG